MQPPSTQSLSRRRLLVTGAGGFIGEHVCRQAAAAGAIVHATSRSPRDPEAGRTWHKLDLADAPAIRTVLQQAQPDTVLHLAGVTSAARSLDLVLPTFSANALATVNVLTAAAQTGKPRVIIAGTLEQPSVDEAGLTPSSPYATSKSVADLYARMFCEHFALPTVVARIFMTYGPGQQDLRKLVPYVTLSLLRGKSPKLTSGRRPVDWVYVQDVASGLLQLAAAGDQVVGQTVDLGSGELTPVGTIAQKLAAMINNGCQPILGEVPDRPSEQVAAANVNQTKRILGDAPATSLDDGLSRTVAWYAQGLQNGLIDASVLD